MQIEFSVKKRICRTEAHHSPFTIIDESQK